MKIGKYNNNAFALIAVGLFIAGYLPALKMLSENWLASDEYSHAFFTLPIIFYMVWAKRAALRTAHKQYAFFDLFLIIISTVFYLFSLQTNIFTLIAISFILTIVTVVIYLFGLKSVADLFTPLLLLVLLISAPIQLYAKLTAPLQLSVSQASEWIIMKLGVSVFREGNIINLPEKSFEVVEACSGLRSTITLITLSVIIGYFMLKKNASKIILLAASIPTAIFINIIRVTAMTLLFYFFKLDATEGTLHTVLGLLVFGIALAILFLFQRVLEFWEAK